MKLTVDQYQIALGLASRQQAVLAKGAIEAAEADFGVPVTREVLAFVGALQPSAEQILEYWRHWHNDEAEEAPALPAPALWRVRMWFTRNIDTTIPGYAVRLAWLNLIGA